MQRSLDNEFLGALRVIAFPPLAFILHTGFCLRKRYKPIDRAKALVNYKTFLFDNSFVCNTISKQAVCATKKFRSYSRINQYYDEPKRSAAYALLAKMSLSPIDLDRSNLEQEFDRIVQSQGINLPEHERKRLFNQLLRDLENDFYVAETSEGKYDFASGLLKDWWRKYYA